MPRTSQIDLDGLNRRALLRSGRVVRQAAKALLGIGVLLSVAWLWQLVRYQQLLTDSFGEGGPGIELGWAGHPMDTTR